MSLSQVQQSDIPALGSVWPWMLALALAGHLAAGLFLFSRQTDTASGGGGQVIGTLSIALSGGLSGDKSAEAEPVELEVAETAPPLPERTTQAVQPERSKPQPNKTQNRPTAPQRPQTAPPQPRTVARNESSPTARAENARTAKEAGPASPLSNATPKLGDGAAATTAGAGGQVKSANQDHDAYLAILRARIESNRTYPAAARRAGQEGVVSIHLTITASGNLVDLRIERNSGHFALDRAAKRMVQKAAPFPAPPRPNFEVTVPVAFALR